MCRRALLWLVVCDNQNLVRGQDCQARILNGFVHPVWGIVNLRRKGQTCTVWVQLDQAAVTASQVAKERALNSR